jgi:hypothetical protein
LADVVVEAGKPAKDVVAVVGEVQADRELVDARVTEFQIQSSSSATSSRPESATAAARDLMLRTISTTSGRISGRPRDLNHAGFNSSA